jgi:hypothetical protein
MHAASRLEPPNIQPFDASAFNKDSVETHSQPFSYVIVPHLLPDSWREQVARDYPGFKKAGFFPVDRDECGPSVNSLVDALRDPAFADALGERLGVEHLGQYPTIAHLRKWSKASDGSIHVDSKSKIVTALLYLNETWPDTSAGCFRILNSPNSFDDMAAPEVKPLFGTFLAFRRTDNSWHGHLPYEGERRVIQVAWLTSEEERLRKEKRGRFTRRLKQLFARH